MTDKEKYRALCSTEESIPVFSRDWWLDIVCGEKNWDVLVYEEKGRILAAFPYYMRASNVISMPSYTQTMGPWLAPVSGDTKYTSWLSDVQSINKTFIRQLNKYPYFLQNFHHSTTDWLPYYWAGYEQSTRYTYILPDITRVEKVWEEMSLHTRRVITKATEKYTISVKQGISTKEFLEIYEKTFQRQQLKMPDTALLVRIIDLCRQRKQGDLWGGYDEKGQLHAAVFVVWQESCAYYLAGGGDPALRDSGAHALVLWRAIQAMIPYTRKFDFEGSMIPGVERFFREFGAIQTPYFTISKGKLSLLHRAWLKLVK